LCSKLADERIRFAKNATKIRRDGWTPERQLRFLGALARTRSVTRAARAAGMSRESAYRLRSRREGALFAAAWDRALESHKVRARSPSPPVGDAANSRGNASKVTKWKKCKTPRFDAWQNVVRDFRSAR
jgi:hypothetical protein